MLTIYNIKKCTMISELSSLIKKISQEVKIKYLPDEYCKTSNITGKYFSDAFAVEVGGVQFNQRDIALCKVSKSWKISNSQLQLNLAHELAHHFWHTRLSEEEKNNWKKLYNACSSDWYFARVYWKENEKEDFATVFELYSSAGKSTNKYLLAKHKYMGMLITKYK